jgi:hypothetical protein
MSEDSLYRGSPFEAYEFVEVTFPVFNQDVRIPHSLAPEDPDSVGYMVVSNDGEGVVSDSRKVDGGTPWTRTGVFLRINRAPSTVRLLLVVLKPQ